MKRKLLAAIASGILLVSSLGFGASAESTSVPTTGVASSYTDRAEGLYNSNGSSGTLYSTTATASLTSSTLIASYSIDLYVLTNNTFVADVVTFGVDTMAYIGVKDFTVQRYIDGAWENYIVFDQLMENTSGYSFSYYTPELPSGYYYRVTAYHYAKEQGWFFPSSQEIYNETSYIYCS